MGKIKPFQPASTGPISITRTIVAARVWEKIMSPEERQLLQGVFDRMRNNASAPRDPDADRLIADNVRQQPYGPYFLTQAVIVQEQALQAASQRIQQLEQHIQSQPSQAPAGGGGFLSSIFGGGASRPSLPAPQPAPMWNQGGAMPGGGQQGYGQQQGGYPPQQQGGPWGGGQQMGGGGGGFLHGAMQTAAGVAGGALLFDGIKGLMGGGSGGGFGMGGEGSHGGGVTNNYYGDPNGDSSSADYSQDANQDADSAQDASDYGVDDNS